MTDEREITLDVEIEEYEAPVRGLISRAMDLTRKTVMVGVGSVDLALEKVQSGWKQAGNMADELAERGEKASSRRRDQINTEVDKRQEQIKDLGEKANEQFEKYSEVVLTRAHVPTSEDIESLSKQVSSLNRKLDKVRKEQQEALAA